VEAFEEMYCRISALELLVLAMAQQLDKERFIDDLAIQKEKLFATAIFSSLTSEVADRLTAHLDRYARLLVSRQGGL
jgi:hypothetical protein